MYKHCMLNLYVNNEVIYQRNREKIKCKDIIVSVKLHLTFVHICIKKAEECITKNVWFRASSRIEYKLPLKHFRIYVIYLNFFSFGSNIKEAMSECLYYTAKGNGGIILINPYLFCWLHYYCEYIYIMNIKMLIL